MPVIFLISAYILLYLIYRRDHDWRTAVLLSAVSWAVIATVIAEFLSFFSALALEGLLIAWIGVNLGLGFWFVRHSRKTSLPSQPEAQDQSFTRFQQILLVGVVGIVLGTGITALLSPPNNWDSMTYHLGRVIHWTQNQSVGHYPTHIPRQLYSGPGPAFAVVQVFILTGDLFLNLLQWLSMVLSLIGVSLITERLGGKLRSQLVAVVISATIPMGILQSSSTQTDYVVSLWLVCFVYFSLVTIQNRIGWTYVPALGASLGLAILTKPTAYLYGFPFALWLLFVGIRYLRWKVWQPLGVSCGIIVLMNLGQYSRNLKVFDSLFGPTGQDSGSYGLPVLISNILRNLALHLSTPIRSINLITIRIVTVIHQLMGLDPSDPSITSPPGQKFDMHSLVNHEDLAGNPQHLLLILLCIVVFVLFRKRLKTREQLLWSTYLLCCLGGFLLFCFLVIWSPWRSRLHLPIFILLSPWVGMALSELFKKPIANAITAGFLAISFFWVLCNETRPLVINTQFVEEGSVVTIFNQSRTDRYFSSRPKLAKPFLATVDYIAEQPCSDVGLIIGGDTWEYPLWKLGRERSNRPIRFEHLQVDNPSSSLASQPPHQDFEACMVMTMKPEYLDQTDLQLGDRSYRQTWEQGDIKIYSRS